jgi:hypothetical protein
MSHVNKGLSQQRLIHKNEQGNCYTRNIDINVETQKESKTLSKKHNSSETTQCKGNLLNA